MGTKIQWTDETLNCIGGCNPVSIGCQRCAAARSAQRCVNLGNKKYVGLVKNGKWTGKIKTFPDVLNEPLRWRRPRKIFVNFMSDTFCPGVPFGFIDKIMATINLCQRHTFQILTKHPDRMAAYLNLPGQATQIMLVTRQFAKGRGSKLMNDAGVISWPLPNLWLGTSVEKQEYDYRIKYLFQISAAVHFLSLEPFMGPMKIKQYLFGGSINCHACKKQFNSWEAKSCGGHECAACRGARSVDDCCWSRSCTNEQTLECPHCGKCACNREEEWFDKDRVNENVGGYRYIHKDLKWKRLINQVIIGCESGPSGTLGRLGDFKTPQDWIDGAIDIVNQCKRAGVPAFVKQVPTLNGKLEKKIKRFPKQLQVQKFPESEAV